MMTMRRVHLASRPIASRLLALPVLGYGLRLIVGLATLPRLAQRLRRIDLQTRLAAAESRGYQLAASEHLARIEQRLVALIEAQRPEPRPPAPAPVGPSVATIRTPVALAAANIASDARLFARREDLIAWFAALQPASVAEIGVALGDFSQLMIEALRPGRFVAFDVFVMHRFPEHWGRPSAEIFGGLTHREYYEKRMAGVGEGLELIVEVGLSGDTLPHHPDGAFDLIYIDAAHDYEAVRIDAAQASRLASRDGILIFNDYILYDHLLAVPYGVVQAVNELLAGGEWVVAGYALQQNMFCDIALRRAPPRPSARLA